MPTIHLPAALSGHAAGRRRVEIAGTTVGKVLATLGQEHPGVGQRVLDDRGMLRRHVNVFVNGESIRYLNGMETPVTDTDEVWILPAVSGGSCPRGRRAAAAGPGADDKGRGPAYGGRGSRRRRAGGGPGW